MRRASVPLILAVALPTLGCAMRPEVDLRLGGSGSPALLCSVEADGMRVDMNNFAARARGWRDRGVRLTMIGNTPYRCVGEVVLRLQQAGVQRIVSASAPTVDR